MRKVTSVKPLKDYKLLVEFDNKEIRMFDVTPLISKPVFSFIKDVSMFNSVFIDCGADTWKDSLGNKVDICPNKMYMDSYSSK